MTDLIKKHCLKVGIPSSLRGIKLLPNSSPNIEYELYPLADGQHISLNDLFPGDKFEEIKFDSSNSELPIPWTNELTLVINNPNNNEHYTILSNGNFLSGFIDICSRFQLGDYLTIVYTNKNKDLIICNYGDVASIVVVKHVS